MKDHEGISRPWLFRGVRVGEAVGLIVLLYALASSEWLMAVGGAGVILASYAMYRRYFPVIRPTNEPSMGMSDGGD